MHHVKITIVMDYFWDAPNTLVSLCDCFYIRCIKAIHFWTLFSLRNRFLQEELKNYQFFSIAIGRLGAGLRAHYQPDCFIGPFAILTPPGLTTGR